MKMENMDGFIQKDMQRQTNASLYSDIMFEIERRESLFLPSGFTKCLLACCIVLLFSVAVNLSDLFSGNRDGFVADEQTEAFEQFAQENYFDILSDYYPEQILMGE